MKAYFKNLPSLAREETRRNLSNVTTRKFEFPPRPNIFRLYHETVRSRRMQLNLIKNMNFSIHNRKIRHEFAWKLAVSIIAFLQHEFLSLCTKAVNSAWVRVKTCSFHRFAQTQGCTKALNYPPSCWLIFMTNEPFLAVLFLLATTNATRRSTIWNIQCFHSLQNSSRSSY